MNADGSLLLAASVTYATWGRPTVSTHNGIGDLGFRYLYVGASDVQWDGELGLGLLYMHARHYSPVLGRFLQPDPSAAETNLYGYAENSPVTKVDPSGTHSDVLANKYAGDKFRDKVANRLRRVGFEVRIEQYIRTGDPKYGRRIDIVATKGGVTYYIEVKYRSATYGGVQEAKDKWLLKNRSIEVRVWRGGGRGPGRFAGPIGPLGRGGGAENFLGL